MAPCPAYVETPLFICTVRNCWLKGRTDWVVSKPFLALLTFSKMQKSVTSNVFWVVAHVFRPLPVGCSREIQNRGQETWRWRWRGREARRTSRRCPLFVTWQPVGDAAPAGTERVWVFVAVETCEVPSNRFRISGTALRRYAHGQRAEWLNHLNWDTVSSPSPLYISPTFPSFISLLHEATPVKTRSGQIREHCTPVLKVVWKSWGAPSHHLSLIHIWRCRRSYACRSRWSPYH